MKNCIACLENQPNQLSHMTPGGCLYEEISYNKSNSYITITFNEHYFYGYFFEHLNIETIKLFKNKKYIGKIILNKTKNNFVIKTNKDYYYILEKISNHLL